jgi:hypothetical protein
MGQRLKKRLQLRAFDGLVELMANKVSSFSSA